MTGFQDPQPTHLCANADCQEREWQLEPLRPELWRLRSGTGAFTIAASQPFCPVCGSPLLNISALEPGLKPAAAPTVSLPFTRRTP